MAHEIGTDEFESLFIERRPLIDVRAPVEYQRGAFPTSVNLPLMTDDERHQVGIRYKQAGQDSAIALGAELVTPALRQARTEHWSAFARAHPQGALYCFRGGLRSRISQQWLRDAGIDYPLVTGGYKAMRNYLLVRLPALLEALPLTVIGGRTGSGKTLLIRQLSRSVDLEALANHRGSSFGGLTGEQPGNIDFENRVTVELMALQRAGHQAVYVEDEARLIGRVMLPEPLRLAMQRAPIVVLDTPMSQRIENARADYVDDLLARYRRLHGDAAGFEAYAGQHRHNLFRVRKRLGGVNHQRALSLLDTALERHRENGHTDAYAPFIAFMLNHYYDPMYDYQIAGKTDRIVFSGDAASVQDYLNR